MSDFGFQGPHGQEVWTPQLLSPSAGNEGKRGVHLLTAASRILDFNCTHTATQWQHPPPCPPVDPGVDVATAARRVVKVNKCLALPPPLVYLHPQILLSGSEQIYLQPQMPHCFWKPPGKKEGQKRPLPAHGTGRYQRSHLPPAQGFYTNTPTLGLPGLLFTQSLGQVP